MPRPLQASPQLVKSGLLSELLGTPSVKIMGVPRVTPAGIVKAVVMVSPEATTVKVWEMGVAAR